MVVRNSGIIGSKVYVSSSVTGASGVFDKFDQYMAKKDSQWPYGSSIYNFTSFTFTNPVREPWGPTSSEVLAVSAYSSSTFASDTTVFRVVEGVQYWVVPETGNYTITAKGPSGASEEGTNYFGSGGIVRGTFSLTIGTVIAILVGSRPPVSNYGNSNYRWQGGGGGTFVAVVPTWGDNTSSSAYPLVVAGGGSGNRSDSSTHRTYASANMSPDGKNGAGSDGGTQGDHAEAGGQNQTGGGGGAGWSGVANSHADCRGLYSYGGNYPSNTSTCSLNRPGARGFANSASTLIGGGGVGTGGIVQYSYATAYKGSGGYGGGGPGGWGGQGGAGGYSGGGNGNNSSTEYGGGGGSFINSSASSTAVSGATIGTSTGSWSSGSGAFSGHSILATTSGLTNLGYNYNTDGAVTIEKGLI